MDSWREKYTMLYTKMYIAEEAGAKKERHHQL